MVMDQINEYQVFKCHVKAKYDPKFKEDHQCSPRISDNIKVHLILAYKHDGCHKAHLVAGGHLTLDPIESIYSGVVSTRS